MENKGKVLAGAIIAILIAAAGGYWFYTQQNVDHMKQVLGTNTIYEGISIDGINIGGLTKEEALNIVSKKFDDEAKDKVITFKTLEVMGSDEVAKLTYKELEAKKDAKSAVEEAYSVGRSEDNIKDNYKIYNQAKNQGYNIEAELKYDSAKLDALIKDLKEETSSEAKNSSIEMKDGEFVIEDEVYGFEMDEEAVAYQVVSMLNLYADGDIIIDGDETEPKIKREDNEKVTSLLGSFSTKYTGADTLGRNINLIVGSEYITGTVLAPGEVFSMNEGLGEQTYANGYRNASVIVNGKLEDGIAGGVCQITTTLYNAVVKAELEVIERKNHSLAVGYVPLGQDAAVAGTYKDFKFENTTEYPVYIEAFAKNGVLQTNIYGFETRSKAREVVLEHVYISSYAKPAEKITLDPELPEGEREVTFEGKVGHKVSTYKVVYENGDFVSREWYNDSVYSAVADEVKVGTGEKVISVETSESNGEEQGLPGIYTNVPSTTETDLPVSDYVETENYTNPEVYEPSLPEGEFLPGE